MEVVILNLGDTDKESDLEILDLLNDSSHPLHLQKKKSSV